MKVSDLTAVVLTKNEETYIADCLESLKWCHNVIVLDSLSTDRTVEITHQHGAKVILRAFKDFADHRNAALGFVDTDWVLFVDADERVSPELAHEVKLAIQEPEVDGWWIPTKNYFFGRLLSHGGFYPDYHLRLSRKGKLHYNFEEKVHERPVLQGNAGHLKNPLIHLCYRDIHEMVTAKNRYSALLARIHYQKGLKPTYHLIAAPILTFFEQLVVLKGFKDGFLGLFISLVWSYYAFDEYRRTCMLWKSTRQVR